MKQRFTYSLGLLVAGVSVFFAVGSARGQPSFGVTPSAVSNMYSGTITFSVTGLTNTEKVVIQKWLDLNGNGLVEPGEPLVDTFSIADGGAGIIAGITNVNVPFDSNPAAGAIASAVSCSSALTLETMVGRYVFRLVSPTGHFSPVTANFAVTNSALLQSVSGTVYSNGLAPLPYAVVVAQDPRANNPAGETVADAAGHYFLALKPGTYNLISGSPNYYSDQSLAPSVVLTNGLSVTNNLWLTNGTTAIAGNVYDSGNSNGIGAVLLQFQSGNLFAIAFSDTNGNYSAALAPAFWKIKPAKERLARRAYVVSQNTFQVNATAGNVTNANLALFKANGLFYGRITDNSNVPFANVVLDGNDMNNQFNGKGFSDANGYYTVGVLGTTNDNWSCNANSSDVLVNYILNNFTNSSVTNGQVIQENFVALPITGHISGSMRDNAGNPVPGVSVYASTFNGSYQSLNATTDNSGNYSLGVASGSWQVGFTYGGEGGLDTHGFSDVSGPYFVSVPPTNTVLNITVYPIGTPLITQPQRFSASQFGFTINGASNVTYTVQMATDPSSTNWASLFSLALTNNAFPVVDANATNSPRFYRVKKN
jgi:hypothetical protein